jgi:hypothetical protein
MLPRLTAVVEHIELGAARFFEGIGKDGQKLESAIVIDLFG